MTWAAILRVREIGLRPGSFPQCVSFWRIRRRRTGENARLCIIEVQGQYESHGGRDKNGESARGSARGYRDKAAAEAAVCADACARVSAHWEGAGFDEASVFGAHHSDAALQPGLRVLQ